MPENIALAEGDAPIHHDAHLFASNDRGCDMQIDFYTRAVLTLIALCLIWIAIGGPSLLPVVEAQQGTTRVVIVGYETGGGTKRNLPLPVQVEVNR